MRAHLSYVSPRRRAQRTAELLELGCKEKLPWQERRADGDPDIRTQATVQITEDIREWDYGDYEGLTSPQIREKRKEMGQGSWDIWKDGCPGGEYDEDRTCWESIQLTVAVDHQRMLPGDWTV